MCPLRLRSVRKYKYSYLRYKKVPLKKRANVSYVSNKTYEHGSKTEHSYLSNNTLALVKKFCKTHACRLQYRLQKPCAKLEILCSSSSKTDVYMSISI